MRSAVLALALLLACAHQPEPPLVIDRIVVRDASQSFRAVQTIDDPAALRRITELWVARRAVDREPLRVREYQYALDIVVKEEHARWMYREDGLTVLLSVEEEPTFAVPEPAAFNALLGIGDVAGKGDRAD